jgi:hypothetical protein
MSALLAIILERSTDFLMLESMSVAHSIGITVVKVDGRAID